MVVFKAGQGIILGCIYGRTSTLPAVLANISSPSPLHVGVSSRWSVDDYCGCEAQTLTTEIWAKEKYNLNRTRR